MIDTDRYETMTQHDLIEILNHWEQLAFQKTNEVKRLRHELLLILSDFQTRKTDMYEMRNRIETILKGDEEE
ncbi:MAG: hypothetical protein HOC79_05660 [Euryarchaeota archaeon]|jgi:hypothetical protein|nr:hypothetical protein [Euryarchaeota archaeon]